MGNAFPAASPIMKFKPTGKQFSELHKAVRFVKKNKSVRHQIAVSKGKDNPDEGSLRWFVYLALCFIIPPLAYYLIKRSTDTWFWICFLCYLLTLTFFNGFRFAIIGLLSVVIALLTLFRIDI